QCRENRRVEPGAFFFDRRDLVASGGKLRSLLAEFTVEQLFLLCGAFGGLFLESREDRRGQALGWVCSSRRFPLLASLVELGRLRGEFSFGGSERLVHRLQLGSLLRRRQLRLILTAHRFLADVGKERGEAIEIFLREWVVLVAVAFATAHC